MVRFHQKTSVACRVIEGNAVLIIPASAQILGLNRTGTHIWTLLASPRTAEEIAVEIAAHFRIPLERARADSEAFLADLRKKALVEEVE